MKFRCNPRMSLRLWIFPLDNLLETKKIRVYAEGFKVGAVLPESCCTF